jgi:hypothetical protein
VQLEFGDDGLFHTLVFFGQSSRPETFAPSAPRPQGTPASSPRLKVGASAGGVW